MTDQRFEDWWSRSPARVALSPAAKEVARGVWQAARDDLVAELNGAGDQRPTPRSPDLFENLWRAAMRDLEPAMEIVQRNPDAFGATVGDDKVAIIGRQFVRWARGRGFALERPASVNPAHGAPYVKVPPC